MKIGMYNARLSVNYRLQRGNALHRPNLMRNLPVNIDNDFHNFDCDSTALSKLTIGGGEAVSQF